MLLVVVLFICYVFIYCLVYFLFCFFFFNDTATTEIYTLSYTTLFRSISVPWRRFSSEFFFISSVWPAPTDRKSTRLNSSHRCISYAVFCLKKKKTPPSFPPPPSTPWRLTSRASRQ